MKIKEHFLQQVQLGFTDLKVACTIGTLPHELQNPQEIVISLEVALSIDLAHWEDSLEHTVDYSELASLCQEEASSRHYFLIESLALCLLEILGERYPLQMAKVKIEKPQALLKARHSFVQMERLYTKREIRWHGSL